MLKTKGLNILDNNTNINMDNLYNMDILNISKTIDKEIHNVTNNITKIS